MMQKTKPATSETQSPTEIQVDGFDHIEFYVGNALQACYYYHHGFGFDVIGYKGLETGERDAVSYVLRQDHVTLVLTGALGNDSPVAKHVLKHGDGAKTIALRSRDARKAWETAVSRGAKSIQEPVEHEDENGKLIWSARCHLRRYHPQIHRARRIQRWFPARLQEDRQTRQSQGGTWRHRSLRGQCRGRQDE